MLNKWYFPHHDQLEQLTRAALTEHGKALIIDGHSFPSIPLPVDQNQDPDRPDICIGTDPFHTPHGLDQHILSCCKQEGLIGQINNPYAGTMVPGFAYGSDKRVVSVMIEINRKLYLSDDPDDIRPGRQMERIKKFVNKLVLTAIEATSGFG